jgi:hypothetical protein
MNYRANGYLVWPSAATIASETGYSEKTAKRARERLHTLGLIKRQGDAGRETVCAINEDVIRSLADPRYQAGTRDSLTRDYPQVIHNPGLSDPGTRDCVTRDPGLCDPQTAKEQQKVNGNYPSFAVPANPTVFRPPGQRELAVHCVVTQAARSMISEAQPVDGLETPKRAKQ